MEKTMHTQSRRHRRDSKLWFALLLGMLGVGLCGASLAWACAPSDYGWDAPKAPPSETPSSTPPSEIPSSSQGGSTQSPASPGGSALQATQLPPSSVGPGSGPVSSPNSAPVNSPNGAALRSPGRVQAQSPAGRQATRPVAPVVASTPVVAGAPVAPAAPSHPSAPARDARVVKHHAQSRAAKAQPRATPSDDLAQGWNAPASERLTGLLAAGSSSGSVPSTGADSTLIFGAGLLGLGLAALMGGFTVASARRRRVGASAQKNW